VGVTWFTDAQFVVSGDRLHC